MKERVATFIKKIQELSFFETFKNISIYFSATVAIQALGLISLPVYTHFMDPDNYGIANVYNSYAVIFGVLLTGNLHGAVSRYYYEEKDDFREFMGTTIISTSIFYLVFGSIVYAYRAPLAEWINLPEESIFWLLLFSFCIMIFTVYQQIVVPEKKSKRLSFTQVAIHYLKFFFTIIGFYLVVGESYLGKVIGDFVGIALVCIVMVYYIFPYVKLSFNFSHLKYIVGYAWPLIPYFLSSNILHFFDQWYINASLGHGDAGLYSFAYKIGMLLAGFITAMLSGANPDFYKMMNKEEYLKVDEQVVSLVKLLVLATGFLVLFAVDVGTVLSSKADFRAALPIVPVIVGGYFFQGLGQFYNRYVNFEKKNSYLVAIIMTAVLINVLLNYHYVPIYGYQAAAYTTLVSFVIMFFLSFIVVRFVLKIPALFLPRVGQYIAYLLVVVVLYYTVLNFSELSFWGLFLKGTVFLILAYLVFGQKIIAFLKTGKKE